MGDNKKMLFLQISSSQLAMYAAWTQMITNQGMSKPFCECKQKSKQQCEMYSIRVDLKKMIRAYVEVRRNGPLLL